ncbi:hypothetical protein CEC48_15135 [Pseudomonas sp. K2I15]|nr:hypothetical protein CEC48_15135 [Pseudomonas sp. K2I15]
MKPGSIRRLSIASNRPMLGWQGQTDERQFLWQGAGIETYRNNIAIIRGYSSAGRFKYCEIVKSGHNFLPLSL